ncbi:coiled-coil domain-containing protein [Oceanobacillus locisalsi]|uniref:Coiled-coil domain-containing protein n=1 Tax=Oceanobacillus locisalsi TaxID=546107 RepID=A0ABW3NK98_9BACI
MHKHTLHSIHSQFNDKKQSDENKKELLQRIKINSDNMADDSPSSDKDTENTMDYKELYRKTRKDLQKLKKENTNLKSLLSQEKNKEKKVFQELSDIKLEKNNLLQENTKLHDEIKQLHQQLEKERSKIIQNNELLELTSKEKKHIASSFGYVKKKTDKQARLIEKQRKRIKNLQFRNHQKYVVPMQKLENQVNSLRSKNQSYMNTINDLESQLKRYENLDPDFYLHILYDTLNYRNCREYDFVNVLSRKYVLERKKAYHLFGSPNENDDAMSISYMFGVIKESDNAYFFHDLEENVFTVRSFPNIAVRHDDPVSAVLNEDGSVDIYWKYKSKKLMNEDRLLDQKSSKKKEKVKSNTDKKEKVKKEYLGDYHVLIVTGTNGSNYRDMLQQLVEKAVFIDLFEKSPVHVKHALKRPDYVVICTDSIPHHVLDFLGEEQYNKYIFVHNANEDTIYLRLKSEIAQYQFHH